MRLASFFILLFCSGAALSQYPDPTIRHAGAEEEAPTHKLPNGKLQSEEILKADHLKTLNDLKALADLSQSLAADMERETSHVLSLTSVKKAEEIERLAKRIRGRMHRF